MLCHQRAGVRAGASHPIRGAFTLRSIEEGRREYVLSAAPIVRYVPRAPRKATGDSIAETRPPSTDIRGLSELLASLLNAAPDSCNADAAPCNVDVAAALRQAAAELLTTVPSMDAPLMESGLDSLGMIEFRSRLVQRLGRETE